MALYDWAWNEREVLLIQGDVNSIYIMSKWYEPIPHKLSLPPNAISWFESYVSYSSTTPWIYFNPIVSTVRLNRNISLFRGAADIVCLGSVPIQVNAVDGITHLTSNARSLLMSSLLAGELLWFTYAIDDFLLPASEKFIQGTASWTTCFAWIIVVAVDRLEPQQIIAI
ncbi:hypothetical protein THRCLA_21210 [Thraustotheca clavata]|uniref:Uncharacterized protein n=1 Tax=Thraustotheca clavata TaxID=74557 RepID=A0A1V9ZZL8_9STRA|nr:hypothetical protein THRCLA_21210 [Thraustotheca clavata]